MSAPLWSMNEHSVYFGENHVCRTHNALFYEDINSSIIFLTGFRRCSSSHASCTPRTLMNGQTSYFFHLSHSFFLLARGWIICQKNYIKSFFFALRQYSTHLQMSVYVSFWGQKCVHPRTHIACLTKVKVSSSKATHPHTKKAMHDLLLC